ncbi:hypothetical protein STEG23_006671, partial [Scotinomys teguina]
MWGNRNAPMLLVLPFPSQVVYNRVGKCGSRTVVLLLRILSEKHGFNLVTSDIHNKTRLTKNEQALAVKGLPCCLGGPVPKKRKVGIRFSQGSDLQCQEYYTAEKNNDIMKFAGKWMELENVILSEAIVVNFPQQVLTPPPSLPFGGDQPVYINIIRDPVSRFLSNYFFRRFGDWRGEQNHMIRTPSMRQEERYLDINECILENYPECSNPRLFYIIPYFCGQHPRCREPGEWALERAKLNVNENFLLVGILEELEDVLLLLERFLPHYFKDVLSIYKDP